MGYYIIDISLIQAPANLLPCADRSRMTDTKSLTSSRREVVPHCFPSSLGMAPRLVTKRTVTTNVGAIRMSYCDDGFTLAGAKGTELDPSSVRADLLGTSALLPKRLW